MAGAVRRLRAFGRDSSGQALVEMALATPLLLVLLVGILELGQGWRASQAITHSAREGARLAIVPGTSQQEVTQRIHEVLSQSTLSPTQAELSLRIRSGTGTLDTVTVRYPHQFRMLRPVARLATGSGTGVPSGTVMLRSTAVMRNE
jgi:Flp pilus assembly protein TadG